MARGDRRHAAKAIVPAGRFRVVAKPARSLPVTRSDSGATEFNFSEILGSATAAGISTYSYHPHYARSLSSAMDVWGTQIGYDTLSYVLKEFWPDMRRKLRKSKSGAESAH